MESCNVTLKKASLPVLVHKKTLREKCIDGAERLGCDLSDPVYKARLDRELDLIELKKFEEYFHIVADMMDYANSVTVVGAGRGSSCGSLVCYLVGITKIDPIPFNLLFERFLDINREDFPDVDSDIADISRHLVYEYLQEKYGKDHVGKVGTVTFYRLKSVMKEATGIFRIPKWKVGKFTEMSDDLQSGFGTEEGLELLHHYPYLEMTKGVEDHARHSGVHAAGVIVCDKPLTHYVAVDGKTDTIMCDKKEAEQHMNMLKIDVLGLVQLSIFGQTLERAGLPKGFLDSLALDDPAAFDVIAQGKFSGVFQLEGNAAKGIASQVPMKDFEDLVSIIALARPGPMGSGQTRKWIDRKNGKEPVTYIHDMFKTISGKFPWCDHVSRAGYANCARNRQTVMGENI